MQHRFAGNNYRPNFVTNQNIQNKPMWPSQPVNIQLRIQKTVWHPTNAQVFGQQNLFKPKNTPTRLLTKPTPMSTNLEILQLEINNHM